jgi:hypothetical protein
LTTSLERACNAFGIDLNRAKYVEANLAREFQRRYHLYATQVPAKDDILEWLTLMQHHGAPTRLLDWTYSFFVAVYFAFEEKSESDQYVVWCIDNKWLQPQLGEIWEANGFDKEAINKVARCRDGNSLSRIVNIPKRFVFPANPLRYNERLTIQQGVFLCPSDVSVSFQTNLAFLNECKDVKEHIYKLILVDKDGSFRKKALRHLERMNMSRATLFPGLDGFAQSLWTQLPRLSELPSHSYNETPEEPVLFSISTDGQR